MFNKTLITTLVLSLIFILEGLYPFIKQRSSPARLEHGLKNISISIFNSFLVSLIFVAVLYNLNRWCSKHHFGLFYWAAFLGPLRYVIIFVLFDAWMYLWHRLNHKIFFFWQFHRVHHSDTQMDTTTAFRLHPGEAIFSAFIRLGILSLLGMNLYLLAIYETCLNLVIMFHHSNLLIPEKYDRLLRNVIVTPGLHRVHHCWELGEKNFNYSSIFSFWDRLFRTFHEDYGTSSIVFGLKILRDEAWQSFSGMLKTPFK